MAFGLNQIRLRPEDWDLVPPRQEFSKPRDFMTTGNNA